MSLHIFQNLREELSVRLLLDGFDDGRIDRCGADHVPADKLDQELLQIQSDQLFPGKTGTFRTDQFFLVGIIHPSFKYMSGFLNDLRQEDPLRFADLQHLFFKKSHYRRSAGKGHDYQIGGDQPVGFYIMELVGLVEDDVSLFQYMEFFSGQNVHLSFVDA